jgi:hypothetical protein|tara:strand:+ start:8685 stop:11060 length:2376 start_codon:yes stop_codon:yes gene_type:complete
MGKKIELFHREIETKVLLEVLGVYGVLALVLVGAYYLGPAITGFVTVTKQFNYTDEVNLEFSESGTYVWDLANPGNLKSIKISGSMVEGEAKVYIEDDGVRYLIFDSSKLVQKPSGIFGITGFVVQEDEEEDEEINNAPIWDSDVDSFILNSTSSINLSNYYYDADNDLLVYSSSNVSNVSVSIDNEIVTLIPDENIDETEQITFAAYDEVDITFKTASLIIKTIVEIPINETELINQTKINETLENQTIINETVEKIININLEYGDNEIYDANNDGVESLDGIIDFSVDGSTFNWDVDGEKLCTRYEVYSVENQESGFACFGNSDCCDFVGLESSRQLWDENLFLGYGGYGSTENNIVFAQVLYVDYNLSADIPYSDVAYSSWDNLTAKFVEGIIEFEDVCVETCMFSGNASSYQLIIEMEDGELRVDKIKYIIEETAFNNDPLLIKQIENISIIENKNYTLDLSEYFSDEDDDELSYGYDEIDNITIRFEDNMAYITPDKGFLGNRFTFITANDSFGEAVSNLFKVEVEEERLSIEVLDSIITKRNWTIGFRTTGTGNLTISAIDGTYAEMYNDNVTTANNLDILELRCGNFEIFDKEELIETGNLWFVLMNGSRVRLIDLVGESILVKGIYVENYNCDETGYYTVRVLAKGESVQEFNFGNEIQIAGIDYVEEVLRETFEVRDNDDNKIMVLDSFGNANIKGNLTQNVFIDADENDFVIQDTPDSVVVITNPEGNMNIKGSLNENQSVLLPTQDSLVIENKNGEVVAYVNSSGSLFLKGTFTENVLFG